jgi:hypothetical protein
MFWSFDPVGDAFKLKQRRIGSCARSRQEEIDGGTNLGAKKAISRNL